MLDIAYVIRIWWESDGTECLVYDKDSDRRIGVGSFVVHNLGGWGKEQMVLEARRGPPPRRVSRQGSRVPFVACIGFAVRHRRDQAAIPTHAQVNGSTLTGDARASFLMSTRKKFSGSRTDEASRK
jgi:hypothetical protein